MSKLRHTSDPDAGILVRTYAVTHPPTVSIPARTSDWHQLAYAVRGVMSIRVADGTWVVPPNRAVWIPAGERHEIAMVGRVSVRSLYFECAFGRRLSERAFALNVSPLLRELVVHVVGMGLLRNAVECEARLAAVVLDQVEALPVPSLRLPLPDDSRARRAADTMLDDPAGNVPVERLARLAGASRRTLERAFRRETGLTLGRWRQRACLIESLRLLAAGRSVSRVAVAVGYSSVSAFVAAFRRELGTTPGRYFEQGAGG